MNIDFKELMSSKSDEGLQEYIDNIPRFVPEAIFAAVAEFKLRGRIFTDEEIDKINNELAAKNITSGKEKKELTTEENIADDEGVPKFYSLTAIYLFSIFFGTIYSAILLAINIKHTKNRDGIYAVLAFGIGYYILINPLRNKVFLLHPIYNMVGSKLGVLAPDFILKSLFNIIGALVLHYFFWNKFLGREAKYRTRPFIILFLASVVISYLLLALLIVGI